MENIEINTATAVSPQPRASMDKAQVENEIEARRALYRRRIDSMVTTIEEGVVYKKGPAPLRIWQKRYLRFPAGHYNFALLSLRLVYRKNVHQTQDKARFEYVNRLLFESMAAATVSAQNILVYYKTKDARELPQGLIYLPHITAVDVVSSKKNFAFRIRTLARDFNFATRNASDADAWVLAIKQRIQMNLPNVKNSPAYTQSYKQLVEGTGFAIKSEAQEDDDEEVFSGSEMDIGRISQEQSIVFDSFTNSQFGFPNKGAFAPKEDLPRAQRRTTFSPPLPEKRTSFRAFKNIFRKNSLNTNTRFGPGIGSKAFRPGEGASKAFASIVIPEEKSHEIESPLTISPDSTPGHQNNGSRASNIVESLNEAPVFVSSLHATNGDPISNGNTDTVPTPIPETNFVSEPEPIPEEKQEELHESPGRLVLIEKEPENDDEESNNNVIKTDGYRTYFLRLIPENSEFIDLDINNTNKDEINTLETDENKITTKSPSEIEIAGVEINENSKDDSIDEVFQPTTGSHDSVIEEHYNNEENLECDVAEKDNTSTDLDKNEVSEKVPKESDHFLSRLLSLGSRIKSPKPSHQVDETNEESLVSEENPNSTSNPSEIIPESEDVIDIESTVATSSPDNCLTVSESGGVNSHQPPNSPSDEAEPLPLSPAPLPEPGLIENFEREDIPFSYQQLEDVEERGELDIRLEDSQATILDPKSHRIENNNLVEENIETSSETDKVVEVTTDTSPETIELKTDAFPETIEPTTDASPETIETTTDASPETIEPTTDASGENEESILEIVDVNSKTDEPVEILTVSPVNEDLEEVSIEPSTENRKPDSSQAPNDIPTNKRQSTLMSLFNTYTSSNPVSNPSTSDEVNPHYVNLSKDAVHANFIYKQSYYLHNSNLRYAILSSNGVLTYYRSATTVTEGKSIPLDASCSTEALSSTRFSITSPTITYYFEARSEEERNSWLHAIRCFASA